ncbi:MAG: serine/threonine-protein kinase PknK, partial [Cyanobacteria bacterium P01_F01_bin.53]
GSDASSKYDLLTTILHELAQHQIVHKDIKPANILIQPESKRIELIDFSIASLLPKETQAIQNPNGLEGTLAYLAPEQTGRMNRGIDYRTDFYALGVTLYELLTGTLPFQSDDPLDLVHCHIAKAPIAPHQVNPSIPKTVSAIVMKLMAKNAENRYQSALGLQYDLNRCLTQWQETGEIVPFDLGERDLSDRFVISEKLYGRETEIQSLLNAFSRVTAVQHRTVLKQPVSKQPISKQPDSKRPDSKKPEPSNTASNSTASNSTASKNTEMILIAGLSGIGKTAVVNEVHKPITRQQGYFIKGKFDQLNRNLPLSALLQALEDLVGQILSESDTKLVHWRTNILEALGDHGQVLIDVIPTLKTIIGEQPSVPELSGSAAQNQFYRLLQTFISVFTSPQKPLVFFIDDLQWADTASLQVITQLMVEQENLLFIGAYRDNEVSPAHPLILTLDTLKQRHATINTLTLSPLAFEDTNQLVADTLHCPSERAQPLTEVILKKTEGNPFFTTQFLKSLYEDGHIRFNQCDRHWECDITQINALACTDDVVAFMAQQLQKLPTPTQHILQLAACIGNRFDLETLAIAADKSYTDTAEALWQSLQEGLIIPQSDIYKFYLDNDSAESQAANHSQSEKITYKFLHDRVQQAAYTLIDEKQKQTTHLKIGQRLLDNVSETTREEKLFEIVNHLNIGVSLITEQTQRHSLSQLNLRAGQKAKASTAYQTAIEYLTTGIDLLKPDCWQSQYILALTLHEVAAETALLCGDYEQMQQRAEVVLAEAATLSDRVKVYEIQIQAYASRYQFAEAISLATKALKHFGIDLPSAPEPANIQQAFGETIALLSSKGFANQASSQEDNQDNSSQNKSGQGNAEDNIAKLADLPRMSDVNQLAIIQLTSAVVPAAFLGMPALYPLLVLIQIQTIVEHGNAPQAPYSYASYGLLLNVALNDIEAADKFGQLALDLSLSLPSKDIQAKTYFVVAACIKHHTNHLKDALEILFKSYQMALESGNLEYMGYAIFHICYDSYLMGNELVGLEKNIDAYTKVLENHKQIATLNYCHICQQAVLNLLTDTAAQLEEND